MIKTTEELLQDIIDNQIIIIDQNDTFINELRTVTESVYSLESKIIDKNDSVIRNQETLISQNTMIISLIIVAAVMMFWFKRR